MLGIGCKILRNKTCTLTVILIAPKLQSPVGLMRHTKSKLITTTIFGYSIKYSAKGNTNTKGAYTTKIEIFQEEKNVRYKFVLVMFVACKIDGVTTYVN
jgi:hypothetical protein